MAKLNIQDGSGDKDFFTMLPNFVLNHSTANDQSLYSQIKKHAGENGKCFATEKTLMAKMGIGKKAYNKSLNYLLERKWVSYIGLTQGKTRPIKTYKIENIWDMNTDYYRKIGAESTLSSKEDKSQKAIDKCPKQYKISVQSNIEQEPVLIRTINKNSNAEALRGLNDLIKLFEPINPSYERLFKNKTERGALERLVKKFGLEEVRKMLEVLPEVIKRPYAPKITTPYQLERDLGKLKLYFEQGKGRAQGREILI